MESSTHALVKVGRSVLPLKMIDIGKEAIARIPQNDRDISGLTLSLSDDSYLLIQEEIRKFRKKLL